jgi:pilus assembly protein CpaE
MAEAEKVTVLIVDDVADTRENIRKLLQFEKDVEVVGVAGTGRSGVEAAKELKPDVVIMDINMPDMDGITATEVIRRNNSATQIVILSVQGDSNYMRRAMLAGARDFLTKPPAIDELASAIRRAGKMAHEERAKSMHMGQAGVAGPGRHGGGMALGKIIVVYSPKGGTGATTVAVNLAVTLNNKENPVGLVDGNLQFGDVGVFLNEQAKNSILDLAPRADELDPELIHNVMVKHMASGLEVLIAPNRPEYAENVTGEQFVKVLTFLCQNFSYVVVDTSSGLTDIVLATLDVADLIILLTTQDIPAIKNARLFLDLADGLKIERRRILFVMNRFDKRINILPEKISESFKHEIKAVLPFENTVVLPSINRGVPFMLGDLSRPIAKSIITLEKVVRQRLVELAEPEKSAAAVPTRR